MKFVHCHMLLLSLKNKINAKIYSIRNVKPIFAGYSLLLLFVLRLGGKISSKSVGTFVISLILPPCSAMRKI